MKPFDCCELVRHAYSQIGSAELGYIPQAISCAVKALNEIAADETVPQAQREKAAFACANLLISDFED
ncbi:hypothetical protein VST7929_02128 [Vibrio stylophorae]|uniref:UPF0253 protein VST7929_02128 n=1 Tax=Vibrio stylophorae TaxID=659351 RepID=A0ABM8ZVH6_9VIBR|nr:YaeP family protein [Vibrio stylophorae]CAH0534215.1 hypothetical protein VST7929_02128 [Vibrio stylophorae]